jgi:hypothetical protein
MKKFSPLAMLLLLALAPLVSWAGFGALEGTVRDAKTNQPVAGAQVQIKMPKAGKIVVTTDASGHFLFNSLPPGSGFSIKIYKANYEEWIGACPNIQDGGRATKDISISPLGGSGGTGSSITSTGSGSAAGTVHGIVSAGGQPLAGVTVMVGDMGTTSGGDGSYIITVPAGSYTVTAKRSGYKGYQGNVTVASGSSNTHNITLKKKK